MCRLIRRLLRRGPSPEAKAARVAAARSRARAEQECAQARRLRVEADEITSALRAHNKANDYDAWISVVVRQR